MLVKDIEKFLISDEQYVEFKLYEEQIDDYRIYIEKQYVAIPKMNVKIYNGLYEAYSNDRKKYETNFDFYIFFDVNTSEWLYEEQGSCMEVCLYNYIISKKNIDINLNEIENMACEIKREK